MATGQDPPPDYLNPKIVAKARTRRGRVHAFASLDAAKTALVVIDLNIASVEGDENCRRIIPSINLMASTLRGRGGVVAWVRPVWSEAANDVAAAVFGRNVAEQYRRDTQPDAAANRLYPDLKAEPGDMYADKRGFSAFFPGKCDLPNLLKSRNIDTVLIAGTVTNVCCESSARDAVELGYRVIMVHDANAGHAHGLHEAALNTFYRTFGDVRSADEIVELLSGPAE